jgi:hypothetical protein
LLKLLLPPILLVFLFCRSLRALTAVSFGGRLLLGRCLLLNFFSVIFIISSYIFSN